MEMGGGMDRARQQRLTGSPGAGGSNEELAAEVRGRRRGEEIGPRLEGGREKASGLVISLRTRNGVHLTTCVALSSLCLALLACPT
jgi:hypothetical protein